MDQQNYTIRNAKPDEFRKLGQLMVEVYSQLEGFPKQDEQPHYYEMLENIGAFADKPQTELLVAVSSEGSIGGGVVYFGDLKYYGSGGIATQETNASGFRLLAVDPMLLGKGIGKSLALECIRKPKRKNRSKSSFTAPKRCKPLGVCTKN